jgi:hypothetical protein
VRVVRATAPASPADSMRVDLIQARRPSRRKGGSGAARARARVRRKGSGRAVERGHGQRQSGRPAGRNNRGGIGRWKKGKRGNEALTRGTTWSERGREGGERRAQAGKRRRQAGPSWQREGGREVRALGLGCTEGAGLRRPTRGKEGKGKGRVGPAWREERGEENGPAQRVCFSFSSFLFPSLHSNIQTKLFEFK